MSKYVKSPLGVCQILGTTAFLGATPEFSSINLIRTFNMEKERAHYIFYIDAKCSTSGPNYRRIVIDHAKETNNEKLVTISFNDFNYTINGFWGVRNLAFSFLICGGENTEYNSTTKKCECSPGFYLNTDNTCSVCPLGCICSKLNPCVFCKFDYMKLSDTLDYCFIPSGKN